MTPRLLSKPSALTSMPALALMCVIIAPVYAQTPEELFDISYDKIGDWEILGSSDLGDSCAVQINNGQDTFRVIHTIYTGDWLLGVPFQGGGQPMASIGMGERGFTNDGIQMETRSYAGWAMFNFSEYQHIISETPETAFLSIQLDKGIQSWAMANKNAAIAKMKECASNFGKNPAKAASATPTSPQGKPQSFADIFAQNPSPNPVPGNAATPGNPAPVSGALAPAPGTLDNTPGVHATAPGGPVPAMGTSNPGPSIARSSAPAAMNSQSCPAPNSLTSPNADQVASIELIDKNPALGTKTVFWIDWTGTHVELGQLGASASMTINSYEGHKFIVKDQQGNCVGGVLTASTASPQVFVQ